MKFSTRARYGTRALLELALHQSESPTLLKVIAQKQQISLSYLEHLISPLIAGGIIRSTKGPKGGFYLARNPDKIKLSEAIKLLEGSVAPVECVNDPAICNRSEFCVTRDVWSEIKYAMENILDSTTLQDLVDRHRKKTQSDPVMYYI
ncbi:MAG: Rrf2 family transcriptional regulator [Dehalococcoidales bacterium]|nr:Rrf2 family transcriptional regulator [Dehalococcoidales bacterium]